MISGKVTIGDDHLQIIRKLYRLFEIQPFSYIDVKQQGYKIGTNTLGSLYRMGVLDRMGFRKAGYYSHVWKINERAIDILERRGY